MTKSVKLHRITVRNKFLPNYITQCLEHSGKTFCSSEDINAEEIKMADRCCYLDAGVIRKVNTVTSTRLISITKILRFSSHLKASTHESTPSTVRSRYHCPEHCRCHVMSQRFRYSQDKNKTQHARIIVFQFHLTLCINSS